MIRFFSVLLALAATPVLAKEYPAGYWEKMYNTGEAPAATYSVNVQVADIGKATSEVDRRISKAGGSLTNMNSYDNGGRQMKSLNFAVDAKSAESLAKSFFDLGDLQNYSAQKSRSTKDGDEIREKVADLNAELAANPDALAKMPIAAYLLNARLAQLKLALAAIENGSAKANLQVSLSEPPKAKK